MAPRRLLVAMVASAVMAVTVGAVSAQGRPPTEAETILQQTLRRHRRKGPGRQAHDEPSAGAATAGSGRPATADRGGSCGHVVRAVLATGWSQPDRWCRHGRRQAVGDVRFRQQPRELQRRSVRAWRIRPGGMYVHASTSHRWHVRTRVYLSPETSSARSW
jgi:hypothetical protein